MNIVAKNMAEESAENTSGFVIELEGFEGPLHLLLDLSRNQKVDLRTVSLVELADQYLNFISQAKTLKIELAADYLIMAAWLVYLKSELLLPQEIADDENSAEELTNNLKFQLLRLDAMRNAAVSLVSGNQLNRDFFARGFEEIQTTNKKITHRASLIDLLRAYAKMRTKNNFKPLHLERTAVLMPHEALKSIKEKLNLYIGWQLLETFSLKSWTDTSQRKKSSVATNFSVFLELTKTGQVEFSQEKAFSPIYFKKIELTS